jgi:hypothetical protein
MSFSGPNNEIKDNEFNDLVQKGWLVAGGTGGTYKLSAKGLAEFDRLNRSLAAKAQVLIGLKLAANADTTTAAIKAFMLQ